MIRWYIAGLLLIGSLPVVGQTTYYVASSGNDANTGRSSDSPFQTITKVNTLTLQPGDQVLFRQGDTFRGNLQIRQSGTAAQPIIIDAYGGGSKPAIMGSAVVNNWSSVGSNVWQASCPSCGDRLTGLYRNNAALPLGRYPNLDAANKGYLTVQSHAGHSQLTSQQSLSTNWTGGEAVFRPVQWILNRETITGQSGNTLSLDGSGSYDVTDNWGFFIQNHPATLDEVGEWYYNAASKTIQLYDNQSNPNTQTITATVFAAGISLTGVSYVTVRNLQFTQSLSTGLSVTNSSNLVITNNDITLSGEDGISIQGSGSQVLMENNLIENANNNGVAVATYQNVTFRGNTVRGIGVVPGRGKSGDGMYVGFQAATTANTLIENNVFDNIGYIALNFSTSTTIQHNQISNFCVTKSDGSGLYIWNGNHQAMADIHLLSNVIYNGIGATEGTPGGTYSGANGIYLDDCTLNIEVANNTVYNCKGYGYYLHGSSNIKLTGNTAYNNTDGQLWVTNASGCQPRNNVIQANTWVSRSADQANVKFETTQNDLASYGQIDNNVYARPYEDVNKIFYYTGSAGGNISLAQWQSLYGKDLSSLNSPLTYTTGSPDDNIKLLANATATASQVSLDGTYRDARNNVFSGQATIPAYSSLVLFKDITASTPLRTPENPANAVTGLTYNYYEGYWTSLPDFATQTVVKTGTINAPTLAVSNRDNSYGLRFAGYVSVPTDGVYTFYTTSDDGSKLLIGSTEVVNNDGGHGDQERSGTIGLKAGVHALTVVYFQGGGGQSLSVSYSGPGIGKQVIPDAAYQRVSTTTGGGTPTTTLRTPENPANAVAGLPYSYYEGTWTSLPDFATQTVVKTGTTNTASVGVRNRDTNYGLRFVGYVSVPTDGVYTFYTTSDDGSKLLIGSTEVVSNDGIHAAQEQSGTIGLKAGVHALTIVYFQGSYDGSLSVSYSGPGIGKQVIPDAAYRWVPTTTGGGTTTTNLRTPENPANAVTGLTYNYYEGYWTSLPDFATQTVVKTGTINAPTLAVSNRDNSYGLRFAGYVSVPTDGVYTFYTTSDDGSKLLIGSTEVVNNDGGHGDQERSGTIGLKAGVHALTVVYFQGGGGQSLSVSYSGPGIGKQVIPDAAYQRVSTTTGGGTPTTTLRTPENPANAVAGLPYSYYEGTWTSLPDFATQTVVKTGTTNTASVGVRNRDTNYGLRFVGYVSVPTDGVYTFYTTSDDGSKLLIGSTEVVSNDGIHAAQEQSGTIGLKAGVHALTIVYFQGSYDGSLSVSYSGPGIGKQVIPDAAYRWVPATTTTGGGTTTTAGTGTGLRGDYFNNNTTLTAPIVLTRTDATVNFNWGDGSPAAGTIGTDNFSVRWTGQVEAPVTGNYIFTTIADDGARLWVNGNQLINDWNVHAATTDNGTGITLTAGQRYTIRLEYFENGGGASVQLLWTYPGQTQQIVPQTRLYPATTAYAGGRVAATGDEPETAPLMLVYPVPARESIWVRCYAQTAGGATLQLVNNAAQPVLEMFQQLTVGENLIKVPVEALNRGLYIITLIHNQQRLSRKVLLTN